MFTEILQLAQAGASVGLLIIAFKNVPILVNQLRLNAQNLAAQIQNLQTQVDLQQQRFNQEKNWKTVEAVQKFTVDAEIQRQKNLIYKLCGGTTGVSDYSKLGNPEAVEAQTAAVGILNYFDTLAIGIEQGFLVEGIIKQHFQASVLRKVYDGFLLGRSGSVPLGDAETSSWTATTPLAPKGAFQSLTAMYKRWYPELVVPPFRAPH